MEGEKRRKKKESGSVFQLFRLADRIDRWLMLWGTIGSVGDGMLLPLMMLVMGRMLNTYGTAGGGSLSYKTVNEYTLKFLYVAFGVGIGSFLEGLCWTRTAERQTSRMRTEYLSSVLRQDVGFFDINVATTTSEVVTAISVDAHVIQDVLSEKIPVSISGASTFIFSLLVALLMSWRLSLAALPFLLLFIVPGVMFGKLMMDVAVKMKETYGVAGIIAEQSVASIRTVVSYVGECKTIEKYSRALEPSMKLGVKQGLLKGMAIGSLGMVFAIWAFQAWLGSTLVTEMGAKGGNVFIASICVLSGGMAVMSALPNVKQITEATAAASRIFEMIDTLPTIDSDDVKGLILENVKGEIEFRKVDFAYPSRPDSSVLQGFDLKVTAGTTIGLAGASGSGKSTVISLLKRFYDPVSGDILLDGENITGLQLKWLRSQMGLVSQEPILFATSIKQNILFGNDTASMELVVNAAKAANAHDWIAALPNGYDTQVGQLGLQMSGGQKQRIAIARALLKDPRILLLDEATSALDAQSERAVQDALDQASVGRTTIIIAHRLSTLCNADSIAVLQSGKIIELGSHDQLFRVSDGACSKMVELQKSTIEVSNAYGSVIKERNKQNSDTRIFTMNSPGSSPGCSTIQDQVWENPNEVISKNTSSSPSQWRMLKMNSPEWKIAIFGCFGATGFGAVLTLQNYCMGSVIGVYFLNDKKLIRSKIKLYCYYFLAIAFVAIVANVIQHYNFAVMGERLTKRIREKMLERMLTFEIGWFDRDENSSAAICTRLAMEANVVRSLVGDRLSLILQVLTTASLAFGLGLVIAWRVAVVMIGIMPLIIGSIYMRRVLMRDMSTKARKAQNESSQLASEAVVNHRTITAFSSQERVLDLYKDSIKGPQSETMKLSWFIGLGLFFSSFVTTGSVALTFWYGGRLLIQGLLIPKHLFQAFFILMGTGKVIADAGSMTSDLAKGSNAVKSVFEIIDKSSEIDPDDPHGIKASKPIEGHIELKNVYFSYPSRPRQTVFRGLSLNIEAGKTVGLVGASGSGKSTIINLIERFYDPLRGSVEIDSRDVKSYNLRHLRSQIALVSQEPTLFASSIRENIAYGNENASEAEIMEAADLAHAHEFISSMEDGYETYCGERGVQLSGGQKQRIVLARAMLKKPAILLLDEATSALDAVSESLVQEAMEKLMVSRTCIIVAHHLSTIQKSDFIAVIEDGRITEQGSHSNLLSLGQSGSYYSLIKLREESQTTFKEII